MLLKCLPHRHRIGIQALWLKCQGASGGRVFFLNIILVGNIGKKCHLTCSLDSGGELSLVKSAGTGYASGEDLCSLGSELSELSNILVINLSNLVLTEDANLLSSMVLTECGTLSIFIFHDKSKVTFPTHDFYIRILL